MAVWENEDPEFKGARLAICYEVRADVPGEVGQPHDEMCRFRLIGVFGDAQAAVACLEYGRPQ